MKIDGWKYYNHAAIPAVAPHENVDASPVKSGSIWSLDGEPMLARWTSDFDCGYETNWWYVIKDMPYDINEVKAKRRYEVNKGVKNFDVKPVDCCSMAEDLYEIAHANYSQRSKGNEISIDKNDYISSVKKWHNYMVFGAYEKESGRLCGYARLQLLDKCIDFMNLTTLPQYEKLGINAAIVYALLQEFSEKLANGYYICDGQKNVLHKTAFQDYLEKYFGFRKAYCKLHVRFRPKLRIPVKLLFPFRGLLKMLDGIGIIHQINSVLALEESARKSAE